MNKRWLIALLAVPALLLLGGCAIEPAYRYNANAGGGYYYGQSPYGNADTVIEGNVYLGPWGLWGPWSPWGPAFGTFDWSYPAWSFGAWGPYGGYYRYRHPYYRAYGHSSRRVDSRRRYVRRNSPTPHRNGAFNPGAYRHSNQAPAHPAPDRHVAHPTAGSHHRGM